MRRLPDLRNSLAGPNVTARPEIETPKRLNRRSQRSQRERTSSTPLKQNYILFVTDIGDIVFSVSELMQRANAWSQLVIGAAIEVHRIKGPGLIETIYSKCLGRECNLRKIPFVRELEVAIEYKGFVFDQPLQLDFLIDDVLILELKAVEQVIPAHKAQLLSYMKLLNKPVGLLINFHEPVLRNGIHRMILKDFSSPS